MKTLRRLLVGVGLSTGLVAAVAGAATSAHPVIAGLNHSEPLVRDR